MHPDTAKYNQRLALVDQGICDVLAREIDGSLSEAENKIWHAHPVWFLDGNPVVGYSKLKGCIRLLFWSGQSFEEDELKKEGGFKAAEIRYTSVEQVNRESLKRWLTKAREVQWDYKNIVRRKGRLLRLGCQAVARVQSSRMHAAGMRDRNHPKQRNGASEADPTPLPMDVAAALRAAGLAEFFADCTRSHQNEYLKWIGEAKRPETRQARIGKAMRMLSEKRAEETARATKTGKGPGARI